MTDSPESKAQVNKSEAQAPALSRSLAVFFTFLKLGLTSFGGPVAHLGYFRKELVERQGWVSEAQYAQLLAICQFLPGPASSQLGFALGLLRGGWLGALAAFVAFTLPSVVLLFGFAVLLPYLSGASGLAVIHGFKLVACVVVADAVLSMGQKLCPDWPRRLMAALAATALLLLDSSGLQLVVVLGGALLGLWWCRDPVRLGQGAVGVGYSRMLGLWILLVFGVLLLGLSVLPLAEGSLLATAEVFYRAGALVFGGGHVVLPLLEQSLVEPGWVSEEHFLAGYGAAQAIPGPMFAFAAYLGALMPEAQASWWVNGCVALVCMFLPGFLLVSALLPWWQSLLAQPRVARAVAGVNAVVVGLLAAVLYDPVMTTGIRSLADAGIALCGFGLLRVGRCSSLWVVGWCVLASWVLSVSLWE